MLRIYFGKATSDVLFNTRVYFDNNYETEWITSDLARKMIKDIDKSDVISGQYIESPVLGTITPRQLSGGVKTLLLALNESTLFLNASTCGNNCAKWLLEIGKQTDITVNLGHIMDFGDGTFDIYIVNNDVIVHNMYEMFNVTDIYL